MLRPDRHHQIEPLGPELTALASKKSRLSFELQFDGDIGGELVVRHDKKVHRVQIEDLFARGALVTPIAEALARAKVDATLIELSIGDNGFELMWLTMTALAALRAEGLES